MNKLVKSQETLTVQAGTNASCYCYYACGSQNVTAGEIYKRIERDTSRSGISIYSNDENN